MTLGKTGTLSCVAVQCSVPEWRANCSSVQSRYLRRVPANLFLAAAYLGLVGGFWLGALFGIAVAVWVAFGSYALDLGWFAIFAGSLVGIVSGLTIGLLNGLILTLLSHTPVLRRGSGLSLDRISGVAAITTCVGSLALLYPLFQSSGEIFVYPPVIAATLLALPMSRKLRVG